MKSNVSKFEKYISPLLYVPAGNVIKLAACSGFIGTQIFYEGYDQI